MSKAGGIIGIVGGIFGTLAAIMTLFVGGVGSAFNADNAGTIVGLGWGGLAAAFISIILAGIALGSPSRLVGALLIVDSIAGAIGGGTLVAICMALNLIAGVLITIGGRPTRRTELASS